jgi:hypothetical protein
VYRIKKLMWNEAFHGHPTLKWEHKGKKKKKKKKKECAI